MFIASFSKPKAETFWYLHWVFSGHCCQDQNASGKFLSNNCFTWDIWY